jgi:hypothetical protein
MHCRHGFRKQLTDDLDRRHLTPVSSKLWQQISNVSQYYEWIGFGRLIYTEEFSEKINWDLLTYSAGSIVVWICTYIPNVNFSFQF